MIVAVPHSDRAAALAALAWQVELGADEAIGETPVNRFEAVEAPPPPPPAARVPLAAVASVPGPVAGPVQNGDAGPEAAAALAGACADLDALRAALAAFEGCPLKRGARNLVFADGHRGAAVMIVGEAPGREEDIEGRPFVGRSGRLLDRMLAAIGLSRAAEDPARAVYITNVLPWRPPGNREPASDEIAVLRPFLMRHVALKAPKVLVPMGASAARTLLGSSEGITRLRGRWTALGDAAVLPTFHPAALLRDPMKKREVWADLLALRARLDEETGHVPH